MSCLFSEIYFGRLILEEAEHLLAAEGIIYDTCRFYIRNIKALSDDEKLKYILKHALWKVTVNYIGSIWEKRKSLEYA